MSHGVFERKPLDNGALRLNNELKSLLAVSACKVFGWS